MKNKSQTVFYSNYNPFQSKWLLLDNALFFTQKRLDLKPAIDLENLPFEIIFANIRV
jgi:hypothetical protein